MHRKQVPLRLGDEQGHVVKLLRGNHANLFAIELKHGMQAEAPITEADPLVLGDIRANPLLGWQDSGQAQEIALQRVAKVRQESLIAQ